MSDKPRSTPRSLRFIVGMGWLMFGAGLLSFIFLFQRHGGTSVPRVRWRSRWGQPHQVTFRDPLAQFSIDHPSDWDESAPFERFTHHKVGDLVAADTVALRHADPTGLVVVIRYTAPKPLSHAEWLKRTRPGGPLGDVFGEKILARVSSRLADHEALKVVAEGTEVDKTYRFESWLVPVGNTAFRLTIGSPVTEFARAEPTFRRIVASFRLIPLRKMSSLSVSLLRVSPGARPPSLRSSPAPCCFA